MSIDELIKIKKTDYTSKDLLKKYEFVQPDDLKFTVTFIGNLFRRYCLNEISETELLAQFPQLPSGAFLSILAARKPEITNYLIKLHNSKPESPILESFDWNIKWVMGNSSLSTMRNQIATLILNTRDHNEVMQQTFFELDKSKLDELIKIVMECKEKLDEKL